MITNLIDPETGTFTLDDRGRALSLIRAELWPIELVAPGGVFDYVDEDEDGEPRVNRQQLINNTIVETRGIIQEISGITETTGIDQINFPVPFSRFWGVTVTAVVEVDADATHRNATIQQVNNENFRVKSLAEGNNTVQPGRIHWRAKGLKPRESEVFPTLPAADPNPEVFNFGDQFGDNFALSFSNNANVPRQMEVILDGVPYETITDLNAGVSIKSEQRVDGLYKHLLSFDSQATAFQNIDVTGTIATNGTNDETVISFYAE